jgi:hypothetical protein
MTATFTIEQYCKRRFLKKKHTDYLTYTGERVFFLREYPVRRVLAVYAANAGAVMRGEALFSPESLVEPEQYYCLPDEEPLEDMPFSLVLRPSLRLSPVEISMKVRYLAGYAPGGVPADLASACLELASWNFAPLPGGGGLG